MATSGITEAHVESYIKLTYTLDEASDDGNYNSDYSQSSDE